MPALIDGVVFQITGQIIIGWLQSYTFDSQRRRTVVITTANQAMHAIHRDKAFQTANDEELKKLNYTWSSICKTRLLNDT